jgi:hypothetical protein
LDANDSRTRSLGSAQPAEHTLRARDRRTNSYTREQSRAHTGTHITTTAASVPTAISALDCACMNAAGAIYESQRAQPVQPMQRRSSGGLASSLSSSLAERSCPRTTATPSDMTDRLRLHSIGRQASDQMEAHPRFCPANRAISSVPKRNPPADADGRAIVGRLGTPSLEDRPSRGQKVSQTADTSYNSDREQSPLSTRTS